MERLVEWNCKEKNSALPKCINEFGDTVSIEDICAQLATLYDIIGDCDLDYLEQLCSQRMTMREDVAARMKLVRSIPLDHLRELVEADCNGRCVVLPCKIDDEVYVNIMGKTLPSTVVSVSWITETPTFKAMHGVQLCFIFKSEDVGKTIFLTREAAEAALKGE